MFQLKNQPKNSSHFVAAFTITVRWKLNCFCFLFSCVYWEANENQLEKGQLSLSLFFTPVRIFVRQVSSAHSSSIGSANHAASGKMPKEKTSGT